MCVRPTDAPTDDYDGDSSACCRTNQSLITFNVIKLNNHNLIEARAGAGNNPNPAQRRARRREQP
eukprot:scaffold106_cov380-Prasinococcus_capsulatus_cf.AAC.36